MKLGFETELRVERGRARNNQFCWSRRSRGIMVLLGHFLVQLHPTAMADAFSKLAEVVECCS